MPSQIPRFYGITGAPNPGYGALSAIIAAAYLCRNRTQSQLNDPLKRWERLPGLIRDAASKADPDAPMESFVSNLCRLANAPGIAPRALNWIVRGDPSRPVFSCHLPSSAQSIGEAIPKPVTEDDLPRAFGYQRDRDGIQTDELIEPDDAQYLAVGNFSVLAHDACNHMGCTPFDLVESAREQYHAIATFVRLKIEESSALKQSEPELETIEVVPNS